MMFIKPRPYQQDIINKTLKALEDKKSTLIQLPTGGGKTIISKEIAIGLINKDNKKILFIAPKIVLMDQTLDSFKGLKPQKVHGSNKFDKNHNILISTLHTASKRENLNRDVIIIDEIHYGYDGEMLKKLIENNPNVIIIGLSATPYDENGYLLEDFDEILNDYDLTYMIKNKYLVPLRSFVLVKPDLSNVSIIAGDYELNQLSEAVSKNAVIMEIVTTSKPYIEKSIKTIVFAVDINHAELLKTAFQNESFTTESLHSKSEEDDNKVIERFKKGYIKVLVSVLKLTTGFDVPETDLAIIARPTKSQNLYKQMVGRVLRIAPDKKNAILLDCGNVIENLGKPLDPIIPKDELEKKTQKLKCKHCESENIKLKKSTSNLYWECQDCGHKEDLKNKNHYKCKNCGEKYSYENGDFELVNKVLYLNCECGYETEISMATGDEEFKEVDSGIDVEINEIEYLLFEEAKRFVKKLSLKDLTEWESYCRHELKDFKKRPDYIPNNPEIVYENKWISWEDWLGREKIEIQTKMISIQDKEEILLKENNKTSISSIYLSFSEARKFARRLEYKDKSYWDYLFYDSTSCNFPDNIPKNPEIEYSNQGWKSWNDWLGINNSKTNVLEKDNSKQTDKYFDFYYARKIIRELELQNEEKYYAYILNNKKQYNMIPRRPDVYYYDKGWLGWNDWLGNMSYLNYQDARIFVKELKLKSKEDWQTHRKNKLLVPRFIPQGPLNEYKYKGWIDWNDWLGIENHE